MGEKVATKDLDAKTVEGKGSHLAVIIEFPSQDLASDAYSRADYQELSKLRLANYSDPNITVMDGSVTH